MAMPIAAPMLTFEFGDVVRAPFPYTDRDTRQHRPALVVASNLGAQQRMVWVLMITSAENRPWPGDVHAGEDYRACGLPAPSVIRTAKIATVEMDRIARVGSVSHKTSSEVRRLLTDRFVE